MAIPMETQQQQQYDSFHDYTNDDGISIPPIWMLMLNLLIYKNPVPDYLAQSRYLGDTIINIPYGVSPY